MAARCVSISRRATCVSSRCLHKLSRLGPANIPYANFRSSRVPNQKSSRSTTPSLMAATSSHPAPRCGLRGHWHGRGLGHARPSEVRQAPCVWRGSRRGRSAANALSVGRTSSRSMESKRQAPSTRSRSFETPWRRPRAEDGTLARTFDLRPCASVYSGSSENTSDHRSSRQILTIATDSTAERKPHLSVPKVRSATYVERTARPRPEPRADRRSGAAE